MANPDTNKQSDEQERLLAHLGKFRQEHGHTVLELARRIRGASGMRIREDSLTLAAEGLKQFKSFAWLDHSRYWRLTVAERLAWIERAIDVRLRFVGFCRANLGALQARAAQVCRCPESHADDLVLKVLLYYKTKIEHSPDEYLKYTDTQRLSLLKRRIWWRHDKRCSSAVNHDSEAIEAVPDAKPNALATLLAKEEIRRILAVLGVDELETLKIVMEHESAQERTWTLESLNITEPTFRKRLQRLRARLRALGFRTDP